MLPYVAPTLLVYFSTLKQRCFLNCFVIVEFPKQKPSSQQSEEHFLPSAFCAPVKWARVQTRNMTHFFHHCIMFFLAALEDLRSGAGEGTTQLEGKVSGFLHSKHDTIHSIHLVQASQQTPISSAVASAATRCQSMSLASREHRTICFPIVPANVPKTARQT